MMDDEVIVIAQEHTNHAIIGAIEACTELGVHVSTAAWVMGCVAIRGVTDKPETQVLFKLDLGLEPDALRKQAYDATYAHFSSIAST